MSGMPQTTMAPSNGGNRGPKTTPSASNRPSVVPVIPIIPLSLSKPRFSTLSSGPTTPTPPDGKLDAKVDAKADAAPVTTVRRTPAAVTASSTAQVSINGIDRQDRNPAGSAEPETEFSRLDEVADPPVAVGPGPALPSAGDVVPPTPSTRASKDTSKESATPPSTASFQQQKPSQANHNPPQGTSDLEPAEAIAISGLQIVGGPAGDTAEQATNSSIAVVPPQQAHLPQPNDGGLVMFGGLHDSNTASPTPLSGGSAYPHSALPFQPETLPLAHMDAFGRPMLTSPTIDGFPPGPGYRGTSTPHSFHGSQASFQADENGQIPYPPLNGHANYGPRPVPMTTFPANMDPRLVSVMAAPGAADAFDSKMHSEAVINLQSAFANAEFADCLFEVRLPHSHTEDIGDRGDTRDAQAPLKIPSHRVVLARSPTLKRRLHTHGTATDGTLLVYGDDKYLRADALYYAVRTLYGLPLGSILPTYVQLRSVKDQFDLALGYAAAGRFLQLDPILRKGVRAASRLVTWETVERAFEYSLPGYICPYTSSPTESSPTRPRTPDVWATSVREILNSALAFVVHNLPSDFVLDHEPSTPAFGRLPSAFQTVPSTNAPTIARGTSIPSRGTHSRQASASATSAPQMPPLLSARPLRNPNLASIKFGDLSPSVANGSRDSPPPRFRPTSAETLLSRILLHLPFNLLKEILEDAALGSQSGGLTLAGRHKVMVDVVQERENRRIRAVENLRRQTGPLYHFYKSRVSSFEAQPVDGDSDYKANNMSLKEEVTQATPDGPCLAQSWQRYEFSSDA